VNQKQNQKMQDAIERNEISNSHPGYGIVLAYHPEENTVDVLMSQPGSDAPGEMFTGVPCPTTMGLQVAGPEIGRPCWVMFKDGTRSTPMVSHFFNYSFDQFDYRKQYYVYDDLPRFMMEL